MSIRVGMRPLGFRRRNLIGQSCAVGRRGSVPILLLHIGHDIDERGSPLSAILCTKLLEHDLRGLAIRGALRDEMEPFGVGHVRRSIGLIQFGCHGEIGSDESSRRW